eukprot:gene2672-2917_t
MLVLLPLLCLLIQPWKGSQAFSKLKHPLLTIGRRSSPRTSQAVVTSTSLSVLPADGALEEVARNDIILQQLAALREQQQGSADGLLPGLSHLLDSLSSSDGQSVLLIISAMIYLVADNRPRGSVAEDLVDIGRSPSDPANLGLLAKKFIAKDTSLGYYPGFIKSVERTTAGKVDDKALQQARKYLWAVGKDKVLDPTDRRGQLPLQLSYLFGGVKVPTTLARIREPSLPFSDNLYTASRGGDGVEIFASRDIVAGEELFLIRRTPALPLPEEEIKDVSERNTNPEDSATSQQAVIEPIVLSEDRPFSPSVLPKQEGFLGELVDRDDRYREKGIISPQDAEKRFRARGQGMFGESAEDRELMDSLLGQSGDLVPPAATPSTGDKETRPVNSVFSTRRNPLTSVDGVESKSEEDEELLDRLFQQLQRDIRETAPTGSDAKEGEGSSVLSKEDVERLQNKFDQLSDEEVESVFRKLRKNFGKQLLKDYQEFKKENPISSMPAVPPKNEVVRNKYQKEFHEVEKELEKLYQDPIAVWQDMLQSPEKWISGEGNEEDKSK